MSTFQNGLLPVGSGLDYLGEGTLAAAIRQRTAF